MRVPVVNFSKCSLLRKDDDISEESYKETGHELYEACRTAGFAYLSKTGLPRSKADAVNNAAGNFFARPLEYKRKFMSENPLKSSYIHLGGMTLCPERSFDYQEGFRVAVQDHLESWPDVPCLKNSVVELKQLSKLLLLRVLLALGHGMNLKDPRILANSHKSLNEPGNATYVKLIHYPPITEATSLKEGQMRIAEHTDFGSLTLLFQDEVGGLQVQNPDGDFIDVPYIPETVLLNVGDMMQFWTGGELKSTVHRVTIPTDPTRASLTRRSITYFANADDNVLLSKLKYVGDNSGEVEKDSSTEYITSREYFVRRFNKSYI